jgi:hypothetical protein
MPLAKLGGSATELSVTDELPERCCDRSSMPTRQYDPLINIAHLQ